jgi:hypothetical protein
MARRNPLHNTSVDDFLGHLPAGPLADGTTRLARSLTSQGHDLAHLLWGDPAGSPGTRRIPQPFFQAQILQAGSLEPQPAIAPKRTVSTSRPTWRAI